MNPNAIGLIEVRGLVAAVEAADAMLKAASVTAFRRHSISPGLVTVVVEGDLASCRAAVDAGVAAVQRFGGALAQFVIGRPDRDTWELVGPLLWESEDERRPPDEAEELLAYVATVARGRTAQGVARHFKRETAAVRAQLDRLVAAGRLRRAGTRYLAAGGAAAR
ncbi:BMC domain-containing protein [Pseudothauera rhizosphaerae]|uniref:BMC domain-containing protein n=1 Tax=Pseudothauera rhizosphaerae TaxID=2565932 RepID=A0A4S4AIW7_9RHOO|nr:BMC domain-containing protein [Pseudothauera rhizosphaerae]THF59314.1 BMC domain-containing protein [Pseudothauera rhizosphaerae]